MVLDRVGNIFSDPCQSVEFDPPPGPTIDDLVAAFADVPALNATAATDVTVDGFHGQQIEFTVPDYTDDECLLGGLPCFNTQKMLGRVPGSQLRVAAPATIDCGSSTSTAPVT